jgi:hypothetical protein
VEGVDLKGSAMTNRSPNAVRRLVALRRLARGLGGVGLSAAWLAGVGAAGAVVSMREAYPRAPHAGPAEGWPPARPVPEGRLAVAVVLGASGSVITDALGPYEVFARSVDSQLMGWSADRGLNVELPNGGQAAGQFSFDAMLGDLAGHSDQTTARVTAKSIEYPTEQLELAGAGWPWRPTVLLALTATAALGVALVPAAATRRNRR